MASLHEYFVKDGWRNLTTHQSWTLKNHDGSAIGEIVARLHFDFEANAKYISFYIPALNDIACPEALALNQLAEILKWPETQVGVAAGFGHELTDARDLVFTGRVYVYSERPVPEELKQRMLTEAKVQGHSLVFRSVDYMTERNKWEKPRAFVAHDSRDKKEIAEPLALQLQTLMYASKQQDLC